MSNRADGVCGVCGASVDIVMVKRSVLDELVQQCWRQWANSNSGMGAPVMLALERAVELAGGSVEEDGPREE